MLKTDSGHTINGGNSWYMSMVKTEKQTFYNYGRQLTD